MIYTAVILKRNPLVQTGSEKFDYGINTILTTQEQYMSKFFKAFGIDVKFEGWSEKKQ